MFNRFGYRRLFHSFHLNSCHFTCSLWHCYKIKHAADSSSWMIWWFGLIDRCKNVDVSVVQKLLMSKSSGALLNFRRVVHVNTRIFCLSYDAYYPKGSHPPYPIMSPNPNWYWCFFWWTREQRARVKGRGISFFSITALTTKSVSTDPLMTKCVLGSSNS